MIPFWNGLAISLSMSLIIALPSSFALAQAAEDATEQSSSLPEAEVEVATLVNNLDEKIQLEKGKTYFISTEIVNVRTSDKIVRDNIAGQMALNEAVEVVEDADASSPNVKIKIKRSWQFKGNKSEVYFIAKRFLTPTDLTKKVSPYFVVQNIATEITRVYERCTKTPDCPHRLVFETKMVVGRPEEGTEDNYNAYKTFLGHGRLSEWIKFYQDSAAHYPHWYKAGQSLNTIPPKAPLDSNGQPKHSLSWGSAWRKQINGSSTIYGAFGWFAGKIYPASGKDGVNYQWMHGTMGWGSDGDAAIELTRSFFLNIFSNPGSAGCTRLSNSSIAYLRELLPAGTDIYRVYAREATRENPCAKKNFFGTSCSRENVFSRYRNQYQPKPWNFVLLTDGAQSSGGITADAQKVANSGIALRPGINVIESGTAYIDQYPNVTAPDYRYQASTGKTGDRYSIDDMYGTRATNFRGHFLVDEGRFVDYAHPQHFNIVLKGLPAFRTKMPTELVTTGKFTAPEISYKTNTQ